MVICCQPCLPLEARAQSSSQADATEVEEATEQFTLDLGNFHLKDLRPTRNETIDVAFTAHVILSPKITEESYDILKKHQHRLRDQIIVAVRTAQTKDFREPDLSRLRRLIQIRIDQVLRVPVAEQLLLSEYQFSLN